ncbi:GntR family transcriptional regulator [Neopusillimonas maritima]|jgi:GntR family transcriptional regulator|uniref:GntR family transcriptional regulator n=1 Tax=Neopusillimonas maritima TaxID=2026239 RepID=A0A3A1YSP3_9BURK|nr:GntR family transcriptional regulator [Neopusillimonas maritima]RIY40269.1 GntR family transcriptional regulator [Neopusillimonas maritima]|tara:strand:- start:945 stop:1715 length:771 start_codon:yes stop_codon:yes gene_type:complete
MADHSSIDDAVMAGRAASSAAYSPLYQQIKALLLQSLDQGEWKPGEAIPSEFELAARFNVSQGTVRKAIDELAADHLLIRRQGKGTFVATHNEAKVRFRFLRLTPDDGKVKPSSSRIIDCRRIKAPVDIARLLDLRPSDTVVNVRRVLSFEQTPTILDDIWLPAAVFKGLTAESLTRYRGPLYALFESEYGVSMVRAEEKIKAVAASDDQAGLLNIVSGSPVLQVERVSFTYGDRPMELRRGLYLTDRFHYRNTLS